MGIKATVATAAAKLIAPAVYRQHQRANAMQQQLLHYLISVGTKTEFGRQHHFSSIKNYSDFKSAVKLFDYEDLKSYIELIADGKENVLWKGRPLYFCKSSGTTSGTKYIPVSSEQLRAMIAAARNSLLMYIAETGKADFFDRKMIFLQGSPVLEKHGKIPAGRLSGIVANHVPFYATANRLPSFETNCIEDWEQKVDAIARETLHQPMGLISGIPPWVVMYFEKLKQLSGKKTIKEIFPDFALFAYGGVNYEPYRQQIETLIGFNIPSVETYPASEGFIAFQDSQHSNGLLLNLHGGIFYEFVKASEAQLPHPERISLADVELGVNYALILNTTAGLFGYYIGDTVKFVSKNPYRVVVTGRLKHFISAFGEHVIAEEVEQAAMAAIKETRCELTEFTVAPQVNPESGLPYHEWWIEFKQPPHRIKQFEAAADEALQKQNSYYKDLRQGQVLKQLVVRPVPPNTFIRYMKMAGKLGGQNKVPRLSNNRQIAEAINRMLLQ